MDGEAELLSELPIQLAAEIVKRGEVWQMGEGRGGGESRRSGGGRRKRRGRGSRVACEAVVVLLMVPEQKAAGEAQNFHKAAGEAPTGAANVNACGVDESIGR